MTIRGGYHDIVPSGFIPERSQVRLPQRNLDRIFQMLRRFETANMIRGFSVAVPGAVEDGRLPERLD